MARMVLQPYRGKSKALTQPRGDINCMLKLCSSLEVVLKGLVRVRGHTQSRILWLAFSVVDADAERFSVCFSVGIKGLMNRFCSGRIA